MSGRCENQMILEYRGTGYTVYFDQSGRDEITISDIMDADIHAPLETNSQLYRLIAERVREFLIRMWDSMSVMEKEST
ncbi:MAG: hypothetical protein HY460_02365 [Parcubacteria group bacterium]|nr:hypothetical protein [Parcubacteria group bacterium]